MLLREEILQELSSMMEEGINENGRVASSESMPIHLSKDWHWD